MTTITGLFADAKLSMRSGISGTTAHFDGMDIAGRDYHGTLYVRRVRGATYAWVGEAMVLRSDASEGEFWNFDARDDTAGLVLDELKAALLDWARAMEAL